MASRYDNAWFVQVEQEPGLYRPTIYARVLTVYLPSFHVRVMREGERLEQVAAEVYGDPTLWWMLADANPELLDPAALEAGDAIRVPVR